MVSPILKRKVKPPGTLQYRKNDKKGEDYIIRNGLEKRKGNNLFPFLIRITQIKLFVSRFSIGKGKYFTQSTVGAWCHPG